MVEQTKPTPLFARRTVLTASVSTASRGAPALRLLRGREAILNAQPLLADLANRTGQTGEADGLAYFLSTPTALKKIPHALLIYDRAHPAQLIGAVPLIFEYRTGIGSARVFASCDGRRGVLAAPDMRAQTAAFAARSLIHHGAHIVQIAFCETHRCTSHDAALPSSTENSVAEKVIAAELRNLSAFPNPVEWALLEQECPTWLPLLNTFDATLVPMGRRTRSNLRYYRRRAELDLGCTFVPHPEISFEEFLAFNRECMYAASDEVAAFRYKALSSLPNYCVRGIRDGHGRWLSLIGTRRHNRFVDVDWQMNRADRPAYSLATVMRSYLIAHEISLGSTRLYMEGGTPQPIGRYFVKERIGELTLKRNSAYVGLLKRFAPWIFPPNNYIGQTLTKPGLLWRRR